MMILCENYVNYEKTRIGNDCRAVSDWPAVVMLSSSMFVAHRLTDMM